ncbi:hypothetical protein ABBQ32_013174 [Trebouxia sp. C0010 RCD-2024]
MIYVYTFIVAVPFLGPQDRPHNFALTAFWGYWWPGIFLVYLFLGRICVEVSLRFPASDLWSGHKALPSMVALLFLLLGGCACAPPAPPAGSAWPGGRGAGAPPPACSSHTCSPPGSCSSCKHHRCFDEGCCWLRIKQAKAEAILGKQLQLHAPGVGGHSGILVRRCPARERPHSAEGDRHGRMGQQRMDAII